MSKQLLILIFLRLSVGGSTGNEVKLTYSKLKNCYETQGVDAADIFTDSFFHSLAHLQIIKALDSICYSR
jgi:hypothetical protein